MDRHIKGVHIGEKNVFCEICPKTFLTQEQLKQHIVIHTGEKNFHCDICPKSFAHSSTLDKHKHMHTGEKPWACDVCGLTFLSVLSNWQTDQSQNDS
jgi:KRAB domain-containing zinc finger protein